MSRDITKLHPKVRQLADALVAECEKQGLKIKITDCVRTKEEQNSIGASRTNCKYPSSYHNWGLAFDFCRNEDVDNDGKISDDAYNQKGNFFFKVGQIGKSLGLDWGGDFKSIYDGPHFEYKSFGTRTQIQRRYNTPEKWFASWILTKPLQTVTQRSTDNDIMWLQTQLNKALSNLNGYVKLDVDGDYGKLTRQAVLRFWQFIGWNKDGKDTGWKAGKKTIEKLDQY
jgi:hypothetical protein